jgi:hypothetical protein
LDPTALVVEGAAFGVTFGLAFGAVYAYVRRGRGSRVEPPKPSVQPLSDSTEHIFMRGPTSAELESARREVRLLKMEKEYLSGALTRVYEAEVQGRITKDEMQYLSQKYRGDLQGMEGRLSKAQGIVELSDLESAKEELLALVNTKVAQIDSRLKDLKAKVGPELPSLEKALEPLKEERKEKPFEAKREKVPMMDEKLKKVVDDISEAMAKLEQMDMEQ